MDTEAAVKFIFVIAKEVRRSFECPVILMTRKDYAHYIFNFLVDLHSALIENAAADRILEIVNAFHFAWLQAVQYIENFKKRAKFTSRETILKAINYTTDCVKRQPKYFQKHIDKLEIPLTDTDKTLVESEVEIIKEMQDIVISVLIEKHKNFKHLADKEEFDKTITNEIDELLIWLDRLNDHLAFQFSKVIKLKVPLLPADLATTLQQIIDEIDSHGTHESLNNKGFILGSNARVVNSLDNLQINKVISKIKQLEDRIARSKNEKSSTGLMALQQKRIFLEDRLDSLKNIKLSIDLIRHQKYTCPEPEDKSTVTYNEIRVFNHMLPHSDRCHLVEKLIKLWQTAIGDNDHKSFTSIISAGDTKEIFSDDVGNFIIDKYGRKIYKMKDDHNLYHLNEINELVPLTDNAKHVYCYDECGRYYLTENRTRVYKAHNNASEYILHRSGMMLKVSEIVDGIEYRYDNLGRYYVNENGIHIYREKDSSEEYCHDGLGNLEKIRNGDEYFTVCQIEPIVTEDSLYLKKTVGLALKSCLADVMLTLPVDPIKYLAVRLEKYHYDTEKKQKHLKVEEMFKAEQEHPAQEATNVDSSSVATDEHVEDVNFIIYESVMT